MLMLPNFPIPFLALTAAVVLSTAGPASAQSDRDLRDENQSLQTKVRELQRELDAANASIAELQRRLQQSGRPAADPAAQPEADRVTIDESRADASPRALLRAISESYAEATRDLEVGDFNSTIGTRTRATYVRAVESWANRIRREMRFPVEWHIRLLPLAEQRHEQAGIRVRAVDPKTDVTLGDPFIVRLNKALRRKLNRLEQRGSIKVLVLKGVLVPEATLNPQRIDPGAFNNPRLIGPFAEFEFTVEASSLIPPPKPNESGRRERP